MSLERQEEEDQLIQNEKLSDKQDKIILTLFSILMNTILGILFFYYSTNQNKYGGDQCKYLRPVALSFAIYCFLSLIASIILNPFTIYYDKEQIFDYVNIAEGSLRLIFFITFIIAFIISSNCGQLAILTLIYIILNVVIFITLCVMTHFIQTKQED